MKKTRIEVEEESISAVNHPSDSDRWIFFCHGFGSDKEGSYIGRSKKAAREGFNAVRFDFRGNNDSTGDFINQDLSSRIEDLKSVISYFEPDSYVLFGTSFGGKVALHSSEQLDPEALVLKSPVTYNSSMSEMRKKTIENGEYTHFGDKTIDRSFFKDLDTYKFEDLRPECPVLFFHGMEDDLVPFNHSVDAATELNTTTGLQLFPDTGHSFGEYQEKVMRDMTFAWLQSFRSEPR